jgi:hypothetical protein
MKRILYSLLITILPFGGALAQEPAPKSVTGPGGSSPGHRHATASAPMPAT